ncbi:MAG: sulfurtransferase [Planctomycetota bacterium]
MGNRTIRHLVLALLILACAWWSLAAAQARDAEAAAAETAYPNAHLLATPEWLAAHRDEVIVVDVRTDEYYDGTVIPGAIRLPWSRFRADDKANLLASTFVGVDAAERILGAHGIARQAEVVLVDSVERDGGATASYVFWILDMLGHPSKRVLEGGIDAWKAAGEPVEKTPATLDPVTYAAPTEAVQRDRLIRGGFLRARLDDPHYQILDVRSPAEYTGKEGTRGMRGEPLKLGHIPGAYNIPYTRAWVDEQTKALKSIGELRALYAGVAPDKTIVVYCNSGRRSSFSYFVLRLMGLPRVITYEPSWKEWGLPANHFPVETQTNELPKKTGDWTQAAADAMQQPAGRTETTAPETSAPDRSPDAQPEGGYVSCGG